LSFLLVKSVFLECLNDKSSLHASTYHSSYDLRLWEKSWDSSHSFENKWPSSNKTSLKR